MNIEKPRTTETINNFNIITSIIQIGLVELTSLIATEDSDKTYDLLFEQGSKLKKILNILNNIDLKPVGNASFESIKTCLTNYYNAWVNANTTKMRDMLSIMYIFLAKDNIRNGYNRSQELAYLNEYEEHSKSSTLYFLFQIIEVFQVSENQFIVLVKVQALNNMNENMGLGNAIFLIKKKNENWFIDTIIESDFNKDARIPPLKNAITSKV